MMLRSVFADSMDNDHWLEAGQIFDVSAIVDENRRADITCLQEANG